MANLRPDINQFRDLGHHATVYDWGIQFISIPSLLTGFDSADLNTRCTSTQLPARTINEIELNLRGHKIYQHGIVSYGNELTLTLYETVDQKVGNFLNAYMDMQWSPIIGAQVPKMLNQSAFLLTLLDSENNAKKYYTIIGAWLKGWNQIELGSNQSDVITYQTQWKFDYYL